MKILESYKKIAKSMLTEHAWDRKFGEPLPTLEDVMKEAEVDDEKMIKYKDKDGETKQMKAGSAKTMDKNHPAKQAWDKLADKGGEEEPKGGEEKPDPQKISGAEFDRPGSEAEPSGEPEGGEEVQDVEKERPLGGRSAEDAYHHADMMMKKYAGVDIPRAEYWAKKKREAADAMLPEHAFTEMFKKIGRR